MFIIDACFYRTTPKRFSTWLGNWTAGKRSWTTGGRFPARGLVGSAATLRPRPSRPPRRWKASPSRSRKFTVSSLATVPLRHGKRSEEHTSELQSPCNLVCRLLLEKKKKIICRSLLKSKSLYKKILNGCSSDICRRTKQDSAHLFAA